MLRAYTTLLFLLVSLCAYAQEKAVIGMSQNDVLAMYPKTNTVITSQFVSLSRPDTVFGLPGESSYRIERGKLKQIHFAKYVDDIDKANFEKCLLATQQLIKSYTALYGKPDTIIAGKQKFVNPHKKHHNGYNVIDAHWSNYKGMKIKAGFTFMGGKGEYHFLVNVNYFDKAYPYYD